MQEWIGSKKEWPVGIFLQCAIPVALKEEKPLAVAIVGPKDKMELQICRKKVRMTHKMMMYSKPFFGFKTEEKLAELYEWMEYHHAVVEYGVIVVNVRADEFDQVRAFKPIGEAVTKGWARVVAVPLPSGLPDWALEQVKRGEGGAWQWCDESMITILGYMQYRHEAEWLSLLDYDEYVDIDPDLYGHHQHQHQHQQRVSVPDLLDSVGRAGACELSMVHCALPVTNSKVEHVGSPSGPLGAYNVKIGSYNPNPSNRARILPGLAGTKRHCVPGIPRRKSFGKTSCVYFPLNHFTVPSFDYAEIERWESKKYGNGKRCSIWWPSMKAHSPPTNCALNAVQTWEDRKWQPHGADGKTRVAGDGDVVGKGSGMVFDGPETVVAVGFNHIRRQPLYTDDQSEAFEDLLSNTIKEPSDGRVKKAIKGGLWVNFVTEALVGLPREAGVDVGADLHADGNTSASAVDGTRGIVAAGDNMNSNAANNAVAARIPLEQREATKDPSEKDKIHCPKPCNLKETGEGYICLGMCRSAELTN
jgi:hypothetical protein